MNSADGDWGDGEGDNGEGDVEGDTVSQCLKAPVAVVASVWRTQNSHGHSLAKI